MKVPMAPMEIARKFIEQEQKEFELFQATADLK